MTQSLSDKMARYKSGDNETLAEILQQMEPLVIRYAKKTCSLEFDDAKQEYYIALINACNKIREYEKDAQCLKYFQTTVKNKYYNFCKDYFATPSTVPIDEEIRCGKNCLDLVIVTNDIQRFLQKSTDNNGYKQKIFMYSHIGMSDSEIGEKLGISRQYVYLIRKKLAMELKEEFSKN